MRIRIDELPDSGLSLRFQWGEEQLGPCRSPDDPFELRLPRPVDVELEIQRLDGRIRVTGTVRGELETACHRCLELFRRPLNEQVDVSFVEGRPPELEEEAELGEEELEAVFLDGEEIDMDLLVAEQVFISLPFKVLCSESCKGLCPRCGANLNEEACRCDAGGKGSPFDALKALTPGSSRR